MARLAYPAEAGDSMCLATPSLLQIADLRKLLLATASHALAAASERVALQSRRKAVLDYVPVRFDLYRPLRPALRWTLQCLVGFADRTGRCFPSVRKLAAVTGISKSTVSRHLAALERAGIMTRQRKPGGVYAYQLDRRFLPAARQVSHKRAGAVAGCVEMA